MLAIIILVIILIYSLVLLFVISSSLSAFLKTRVPFVPTHTKDIEFISKYLNLTDQDVVWDLGSGTGTVVFAFEKFSPAKVKGFERGLWMYWFAKIKQKIKRSKGTFVLGNFFEPKWDEPTVIYCYLYPPLMNSIGDKVKLEGKSGIRVVSRDFKIPNLTLVDRLRIDDFHEFFVYNV